MADNRIIRTTALDVLAYIPMQSYYVIQKSTGTYRTSWHTLVATLTASLPVHTPGPTTPPPTTPAPTTPAPTTPPPTTPPPTTAGPTLYNLSINGGQTGIASTTGSGSYAPGTVVSISGVLDSGYVFNVWSDDVGYLDFGISTNPNQVSMPGTNVTLTPTASAI